MALGQARGWCTPVRAWRISYYDEESRSQRYFLDSDQVNARAEYDFLAEEYDPPKHARPECAPAIAEVAAWKLAPAALKRLARLRADLDETPTLVTLLLAEESGLFDGAFWDDDLDVGALSAPRAVIFPGRLERFEAHPSAPEAVRRPRQRRP